MEMFSVLKIKPDHVIDAAQDGIRGTIPARVKHLPRRERRKVRDARKVASQRIAFLEDARDSIEAQAWAKRQRGKSVASHDTLAQGVKVAYPVTVAFLEVDTGTRRKRPRAVPVKVPDPVPILDESVDYLEVQAAYGDALRRWDRAATKAQRDDYDDSDWFRKYAHSER